MNSVALLTDALILGACYLIACRVNKMAKGVTQPVVFIQHFVLGLGLFGSVLLEYTTYADWSRAALAGSIIGFLMLSMKRWRAGAPEDTETKPGHLGEPEERHFA